MPTRVKKESSRRKQNIIAAILMVASLPAYAEGKIILGYNAAIHESRTTSSQAVQSVLIQLGGSTDALASVVNIASNMADINGSISNTISGVSGTINNLTTTALGAVNTGHILLGIDTVMHGITDLSGSLR